MIKNKIIKKIVFISIIVLFITILFGSTIYASTFDPSGLISDDSYDPDTRALPSTITDFAGRILGAISIIGAIITVVLIAVIGFQYITGSAGDIAEIKSRFGGILIGVVLLTAATSIVRLVLFAM